MYVDASPVTMRRSAGSPRVRSAHREATPQTANATASAERLGPVTVAARRTHLAEAIVSQWLLEQLPADHRHARRSAWDLRQELPV